MKKEIDLNRVYMTIGGASISTLIMSWGIREQMNTRCLSINLHSSEKPTDLQ